MVWKNSHSIKSTSIFVLITNLEPPQCLESFLFFDVSVSASVPFCYFGKRHFFLFTGSDRKITRISFNAPTLSLARTPPTRTHCILYMQGKCVESVNVFT